MATAATIAAKLTLDTKDYDSGLDAAQKKAGTFSSKMKSLGSTLTKTGAVMTAGLTVPIVAGLSSAVNSASDLEESTNAVNTVFEGAAGIIEEYGKTSAETVGLATSEFQQLSAVTGSFLQNLGYDAAGAAEESINLTERAADMASVFNTDVDQALAAIQSGLKGEFNPLEQFGVKMNAAMIKAKALEMGLGDLEGNVDDNAKAQAALALIMEQTDRISGDFAATSDGLANSQRIMKAQLTDAAAALGTQLLPLVTKAVQFISELITKFQNLTPAQQKTIVIILGIVAAIGPLITIIGTLMTVIGAVSGFLAGPAVASVLAFMAPFLPVIAVIAAVIAVVILLREAWENNWGGIQEKTAVVIDWIKENVQGFLDAIKGLWDKFSKVFTTVVENTWNGIKNIFDIYFGFIRGIAETFMLLLHGDFKGAGEKLKQTFIDTWQKIKDLFGELWDGIINTFKDIDWGQLGKDIINGIVNGLKNAANWLYDTIKNITGNVMDFAKGILGISSPSTVFFGYGVNLMKGMAMGIKASDDMPIKAAKNLQIENMAITGTANETTPYQSILEYLQQQNQPATAREIAKAVRDAIQAIP